jgi:hypothetical protein
LMAVSAALSGPQPGAIGECDPRATLPGEVHTWFLVAMTAPSADDWRLANDALRKRIGAIDAFLDSQAAAAARSRDPRVAELQRRFARDQAIRARHGDPAGDLPPVAAALWAGVKFGRLLAVDCDNTRWIKEQVQKSGWFDIPRHGAEADEAAWHLVQHADRDPDFQRTMLAALMRAPDGHTSLRRVAYLWDRVAGKDGRPQRYGTQGSCQLDGKWQPFPSEDPETLDRRRTELGLLPMAEHAITMTKQSCTPPGPK